MAYRNGKMQPDVKANGRKPKRTLGPNGSFQADDPKHERLAIGGATRAYKAGHISKSTEEKIQSEARALLKNGKGGSGGPKPAARPRAKSAGENSAADRKQDAELRKKTGMTQAQVERSPADKKADAKRQAGARKRPAEPADHLAIAAQHRAMADEHRAAADKHVQMAVDKAARGASANVKASMVDTINYGGMNSDGLHAAVRSARARNR